MRIRHVLFLLILLISCTDTKKNTSTPRAFYYWQTELNEFNWRDTLFTSMNVKKMYFRFFDVDWDKESGQAVPVAVTEFSHYDYLEIPGSAVPVVYITNETFKNLDLKGSTELAQHVHRKIMTQLSAVAAANMYDGYYSWWSQDPYQVKSKDFMEMQKHDSLYQQNIKAFTEVQFDCDWTKSTREKYFAFLEESKKMFQNFLVTSTIRLYQYKYPKEAGVPPVSRGMLMCYNAGDIRDTETKNSLFDKEEIMKYLDVDEAYPLPLDYALPIFRWAVLYQGGKLKAILSAKALQEHCGSALVEVEKNRFDLLHDCVYGYTAESILLRPGDEIRLESADMKDVQAVAEWLGKHKNNKEAIISLYHLNQYDLSAHSKAIEAIFNSF